MFPPSANRTRWSAAAGTALAALILTSACGGGTSSSTSSSPPAAGGSKDAALAAKLPPAIASAGVIKVGSDVSYAPVEFFDADGKTPIGIDPDLAKAVGDKLGVKFEFNNATFDGLIPAVQSKRFDIVWSAMSDTKERQGTLDFVDYFNAGTSILVKKGNPEKINTLADLCGKTVALQRGTTQEDVATKQQDACKAASKPAINVLAFDKDTDALTQIKNGRAVADMNDFPVAAYNSKVASNGNDFQVVGEQIEAGPYGVGFRKEDSQLRDAVQGALTAILADGTYDKVLTKWNVEKGSLKTAAVNGGS